MYRQPLLSTSIAVSAACLYLITNRTRDHFDRLRAPDSRQCTELSPRTSHPIAIWRVLKITFTIRDGHTRRVGVCSLASGGECTTHLRPQQPQIHCRTGLFTVPVL